MVITYFTDFPNFLLEFLLVYIVEYFIAVIEYP